MKFYVKNTDIVTDKNIADSKIVAIADLHYVNSIGLDFLNGITEKVKSLSPDYICFLGDLVDDDSKEVIDWLNSLAKIAPVYFILGNHDITRYAPAKKKIVPTHLTPLMLSEIKNIRNLEVLNNGDISNINGFSFVGLPFYEVFEVDEFVNLCNGYDVNLNPETFNTMLVHNPMIMKEDEFKKLKSDYYQTDLVLSGHTHNGLVPHALDSHIPGNRGLYSPIQGVFPEMSRGNVTANNESYSYNGIIVPALTTIHNNVSAVDAINKKVYPPAIESVRVLKKK